MDTVEELARKAARLKPEERAKLVEAILSTLDPPDPESGKPVGGGIGGAVCGVLAGGVGGEGLGGGAGEI